MAPFAEEVCETPADVQTRSEEICVPASHGLSGHPLNGFSVRGSSAVSGSRHCRNAGRRTVVPTIVYRSKCPHCSLRFEGADSTCLMGDELFHVHCARRLITDETIRLSRALSRRAREAIEESERRIRRESRGAELDSSA